MSIKVIKMEYNITQYIKSRAHILDKQSRFMFLASRKCGTQSVCRYLLKDRCIVRKDSPNTHSKKINGYSNLDIEYIFKFTIVRNPYERVISAFHALQQYSQRKGKVPADIDFKIFVKEILSKKGIEYDVHFEPQYPNLFYFTETGKVPVVDFIAKLENIDEDWKYISSIIKCDSVLPHKNKSEHNHYSSYYDEETKDLIDELYKTDIQLLHYKF